MNNVKLGDLVDANIKTFPMKGKTFINYLDTGSITENKIENIQYLNVQNDVIPSRARRAVLDNTILYSSVRPNLKHYGYIKKPVANMVASTGFITLNVKNPNECNPLYLYYNLSQQKNTDYLHTIAQTNVTSYPGITDADLMNLDMKISNSLQEQQAIAKVLSTIDDKIELNNKINKELEQMAKTLYDYWFVQFEFPDGIKGAYKSSNGPMVYNEVLKREIPVGWEVKNIKELAEMVWGQCPDGKNILPLDSKDENTLPYCSGAGDMPNCWGVSCQALTNNSRRKVEKGAILLSVAGTIGKMSISNRTISLGRATLGVIPHNPLYLSFLIWFIKSYTNRLQQISVGAVQKIINNASLEEMNFPFSKDLVNQYEYLNKITHLLIKNEEENVYLSNLRDFLLPMLMNGQVSIAQP